MKNKANTLLIFNGNAKTAMNFYVALFENSSIDLIRKQTSKEFGKAGCIKKGILRLNGQELICCDQTGRPFSIAAPSAVVDVECRSKKDMKTKLNALAEGGQILAHLENGSSARVQDKFGMCWQLTFTNENKESEDLNLCFSNNKEVRPEYRL